MKIDPALIPAAPDFSFEVSLWKNGVKYVAGIDEVGRGALAGPVAVGAVIFPAVDRLRDELTGVRDSKQMTPMQRQVWASRLPGMAEALAVGYASSQEIDQMGIVPATRLAAQRAIDGLQIYPEHLLLDYLQLCECSLPQTILVKGDKRSLSIAAASILAKVARDTLLCKLDGEYPGYGLDRHKGYATKIHRQAIEKSGLSAIHRRSFVLHKTTTENLE
jgi:ribonuclease HII